MDRICTLLVAASILQPIAIKGLALTSKQSTKIACTTNLPCIDRKEFIKKIAICSSAIVTLSSDSKPSLAANLPISNGGDLSKTGTVEKLVPIVSLRRRLVEAKAILIQADSKSMDSSSDGLSSDLLTKLGFIIESIPSEEKAFKLVFDEYSDPVSYKQKYMDKNAFVIYYTGGFDGPGRDSIESGEIPRQTLQYGARNECWNAFEDVSVEVKFAMKDRSSSRDDILAPLTKAIAAFDSYLSIAPKDDVVKAEAI